MMGEEIPIEISITDGHGQFQQTHTLNMPLLESSIQTQTVTIAAKVEQPIPIENISLRSDVDVDIPSKGKSRKKSFCTDHRQ